MEPCQVCNLEGAGEYSPERSQNETSRGKLPGCGKDPRSLLAYHAIKTNRLPRRRLIINGHGS